jgi:DNA-cytosine methyltransferase
VAKTLNILDLFSGIGGFSLGFESVQVREASVFRTVAFCEIDADAQKVLRKNWPEVPIFGDVTKLSYKNGILYFDGKEVLRARIDIICGGFPCTDISTAGLQKGLYDEDEIRRLVEQGYSREDAEEEATTRSGLWVQYKRLIKEINPRWVVIENVPNLLNLGFGQVLQDLDELGYDAEWEIISARAVGACHLRRRIWIVAYPNGESLRKQSGRECGEIGKSSILSRINGEVGNSNVADSDRDRSPESVSLQAGDERKSLLPGGNGPRGIVAEPPHTDREGLQRSVSGFAEDGGLGGGEGDGRSHGGLCEVPHNNLSYHPAHSDDFRFWPSFATEEEKSEWWAETTFGLRHWWEIESPICRMDDAISDGLDEGETREQRTSSVTERGKEKARQARIKQLGNTIIPGIAGTIAMRICFHEFCEESAL